MKLRLGLITAIFSLAADCLGEIVRGIVIDTAGQEATIKLDGAVTPNVADTVTVYFKLPGTDDEVLVGTGKITSINASVVKATIDNLQGTLKKEQLARIEIQNPKSSSSTAPAITAAPSPVRSPVYTPPPDTPKLGTAAAFNCDDGSGDTLRDTSNNGRAMKLKGGLGFAEGREGKALNFKDSGKMFAQREKDDTILNFADRDFTIELYANFRAFVHEQVLLEKFSGKAGPGWTLTVLDKAKLHFFSQGAGAFTAPVNLKPNQWYRIAVERRGSQLRMFVDDAVVLDQSIGGAIVPSTNPLLLGRRNEQDGRAFPVNALIDDIRIDVVPTTPFRQ